MLANDTATIAVEVPVYLYKNETELKKNITGHIDLLQLRYNKIHILDYKPEEEKDPITQLYLYAKALSSRANIPLKEIVCAYAQKCEAFLAC